jgi:hypothetical protein
VLKCKKRLKKTDKSAQNAEVFISGSSAKTQMALMDSTMNLESDSGGRFMKNTQEEAICPKCGETHTQDMSCEIFRVLKLRGYLPINI